MTLHIRLAAPTDNVTIEQIENAADQLLIDRLAPHRWEPAPPAGSRAADPGYILVAEETEGSAVIAFVHVLEHDQINAWRRSKSYWGSTCTVVAFR